MANYPVDVSIQAQQVEQTITVEVFFAQVVYSDHLLCVSCRQACWLRQTACSHAKSAPRLAVGIVFKWHSCVSSH